MEGVEGLLQFSLYLCTNFGFGIGVHKASLTPMLFIEVPDVCFLFHYTNIFNAFEHIFISFRDILKQIFITLGDICDNLKIFI
jgi:hypothetical protein